MVRFPSSPSRLSLVEPRLTSSSHSLFLPEPALPVETSGNTFSHILGTNTSAFETLVLKRKIMGPCWLEIKDAVVSGKGVSSRALFSSVPRRASQVHSSPSSCSRTPGLLVQAGGHRRRSQEDSTSLGIRRSQGNSSSHHHEYRR